MRRNFERDEDNTSVKSGYSFASQEVLTGKRQENSRCNILASPIEGDSHATREN
jgi:hypothetical protein